VRKALSAILGFQQLGLVVIILLLGVAMTRSAGTHLDNHTHQMVNDFLNPRTLIQIATDTSFFAIMAVGMTMVIISAGIDLSVGSIYAACGVLSGLALNKLTGASPAVLIAAGIGLSCGIGLICGLINGVMVSRLGVHPFIITLGTMWVYRGISSVSSGANSIMMPKPLNDFTRASIGFRDDLSPVPMLATLLVALFGALYLQRTTWGRRVFAVGGNIEAARYSGLPISRVLTGVYVLSGLAAGIAAFLGSSFYGSASSGDANGYELYVVASAVVGGASLNGGKGSAVGALLGALLIVMIRQAIHTFQWDQNNEWIIVGTAIVVAVVLDRAGTNLAQRRMVRARDHRPA
jgi:ribose transport system permease protein